MAERRGLAPFPFPSRLKYDSVSSKIIAPTRLALFIITSSCRLLNSTQLSSIISTIPDTPMPRGKRKTGPYGSQNKRRARLSSRF